jgi:outer membrane protein OmpA-like peptidoglycan-associated protein
MRLNILSIIFVVSSTCCWTGNAFFVHFGKISIAKTTSRPRGEISICTTSTSSSIKSSSNNSNNEGGKQNNSPSQPQEEFLEVEAQAGAEKVRNMSIEERTKRAMLAEAAEDRMIFLSDELDALLGEDGTPLKAEYREEVVTLAQQIKALQEQYRALVNGEPDPMLSLSLDGPAISNAESDDQ